MNSLLLTHESEQFCFFLRLKSVENSSRSKRARMLNSYCLLCWGFPCCAVLLLWILDKYEIVHIEYGPNAFNVCWIGVY